MQKGVFLPSRTNYTLGTFRNASRSTNDCRNSR
jgi:hypothetical protein